MLVFEHARLLDCSGSDPQADIVLVVEDGRIGRIGASGSFSLPRGADVIDCQGRTLMPGLTDAHVHLSAVDFSLAGRTAEPAPVVALRIAALIEDTLQRARAYGQRAREALDVFSKGIRGKEAEGALVPVLLEKYGEMNQGSQFAAKAGRGGTGKSPRDFGGIAPLLDRGSGTK